MLIQSNPTVASPNLNPNISGFPKPPVRAQLVDEQIPQPDEKALANFHGGALDPAFPAIENSRSAEAALDSIRLLIRNDPAGTLSAQANSRPETVLELLQGLELQLEH
jgi:hypothetical protein